ncbi:unnamed protein product [Prorocentrum cordatum]|uniref:Reverse transcriptase domain-containing protein n=1 Tax=Prorocentrum cordatum TaxID=2364126 RepID=A0ABN9VWQ4_9DINO|nr:unnamed protein product [Polarella glacialis]
MRYERIARLFKVPIHRMISESISGVSDPEITCGVHQGPNKSNGPAARGARAAQELEALHIANAISRHDRLAAELGQCLPQRLMAETHPRPATASNAPQQVLAPPRRTIADASNTTPADDVDDASGPLATAQDAGHLGREGLVDAAIQLKFADEANAMDVPTTLGAEPARLQSVKWCDVTAAGKINMLNKCMTDAARDDQAREGANPETVPAIESDETLRMMIAMRRSLQTADLQAAGKKYLRTRWSKEIQKRIRARRVNAKLGKAERILEEFRGIRQLKEMAGNRSKCHITEMKDKDGHLHNDRTSIAEVFAQFYEDLYATTRGQDRPEVYAPGGAESVPPFTTEELDAAIRLMKKGKAGDDHGVKAELLKVDCPTLGSLMLEAFNAILAKKYGLKVHMGKTVVLTNASDRPPHVKCGAHNVRVLQHGESEKYLGKKVSLDDVHGAEFGNRLASGWAAFHALKDFLCNKRLQIHQRLRLFTACVVPCVLYASSTWTLTAAEERKLRSTQRRMLRQMVGIGRLPDEDWVEYIRRATRASMQISERSGVDDWVSMFWKQKWTLAGKLSSPTDRRWCAGKKPRKGRSSKSFGSGQTSLRRLAACSGGASGWWRHPLQRERAPSISVHKGFKIQAALCVERPPLRFVEPDYRKRWRAFREAWERRTNNHLSMADEIVFMRFHFHFYEDRAATLALGGAAGQLRGGAREEGDAPSLPGARGSAAAAGQGDSLVSPSAFGGGSGGGAGGLDALLSGEGLDLVFPEVGRRTARRRRVERKVIETEDVGDFKSLKRLHNQSLFLI